MTFYDENGDLVMDTDFAPTNSNEPLKTSEGPIKFIVLGSTGVLETNTGIVLEDTEEVRKKLEEYSDVKIIASGTSEVSLSELVYSLQSPTRQLYRGIMSDLTELLNGRFIKDDAIMRNLCNKI